MQIQKIWSGSKVDLSRVKIFGTPVMVHVPKEKRVKWDPKSTKMIFIGYDPNTKCYRSANPKTHKIIISRDVIFHEEPNKSFIRVNETNNGAEGENNDDSANDEDNEGFESFGAGGNGNEADIPLNESGGTDNSVEIIEVDDQNDSAYVPDERERVNESYARSNCQEQRALCTSAANQVCLMETRGANAERWPESINF